ncbi:MAG TPA: ATP-binding protein [Terriglobales bacterium]|nr:ATP-binding protein [Terriglobales bacterium]
MRSRIFFKLLLAFVLVVAVATATLDIVVRRAWEKSLRGEIERSLTQKTRLVAARVTHTPTESMAAVIQEEAQAAGARATVIESSGKVLADSEADPQTMENHATRPEFRAALAGGVGVDARRSRTVGIPFLYVAVPIPGGAVRLAYPLTEIEETTAGIRRGLLQGSALAVLIATLLAAVLAQSIAGRLRRIVEFAQRVAGGDLSARVAERSSDEIAQVAASLDSTARQLEHSFRAVEDSRQQLEAVLNGMQEAVIAVGPDGHTQWANGRMRELVEGIRVGAPLVETVRQPELLRAVDEATARREVRRARVSGVVPGRTFEVTAAPLAAGGAVAVLHDLTEIERVEQTRRDFIANVSHELRTPLTSIQGYAETMLEAGAGGEAGREFLEIIRKNASRMARLTEDLLTLARVESGERAFELRPVEPGELLEEAVQSFREAARARHVELVIENQAHHPVLADRDSIHQVFSNLIDNALKYSLEGRRVVVGARQPEAGGPVEFFVRDQGPGIASDHLPRLFERFYRVDRARSRESGGTGLGLAIAKHIVLAHGGTIRAESELGHGSTFVFTLVGAAREAAVAERGAGG